MVNLSKIAFVTFNVLYDLLGKITVLSMESGNVNQKPFFSFRSSIEKFVFFSFVLYEYCREVSNNIAMNLFHITHSYLKHYQYKILIIAALKTPSLKFRLSVFAQIYVILA